MAGAAKEARSDPGRCARAVEVVRYRSDGIPGHESEIGHDRAHLLAASASARARSLSPGTCSISRRPEDLLCHVDRVVDDADDVPVGVAPRCMIGIVSRSDLLERLRGR
jgi:hypothetical protein